MTTDPTLDPHRRPWLAADAAGGYPLQHLPWGSFSRPDDSGQRIGVRLGDTVVDVRVLVKAGKLAGLGAATEHALAAADLTPLLAGGPERWRGARERLADLLTDGVHDLAGDARLRGAALLDVSDVLLARPFAVADFVDFYSSLHHATNLGRLFRPDDDPLLANWRSLPVGYHGRSRGVVVSGTPVRRPAGQRLVRGAATFGPSGQLDYELEVGFVMGPGNRCGEPIAVAEALDHVFGVVLVDDWSARDIQAWEYRPLGPFLGKAFATTIAGWVTPLAALRPFRATAPRQEPPVLAYLDDDRTSFDLVLHATLSTVRMRRDGVPPVLLPGANLRDTYWTPAQQLAHLTAGGAVTGPGDLFATGTLSGADRAQAGSLVERTWGGTRPQTLPTGEERTFLADGDEVVLTGRAGSGPWPLTLGEARGVVVGS